jgi:hypothetical protein
MHIRNKGSVLEPAASFPFSWLVQAFFAGLGIDEAFQKKADSFKVHWFEYPSVKASLHVFVPFILNK